MSPRSGRPPLERSVRSFESADLVVPEEVVLDTSFVAKSLITTEDHHVACQAFLVRLARAGSTIYYNRLLDLELAESAFKIAVKERHGKLAHAKRRDGRVRARAGRLTEELLGRWADLLESVPHACIELHEVSADVLGLMRQYGLASYDAAHAATAMYVRAGLVTTDAGFGAVSARIHR